MKPILWILLLGVAGLAIYKISAKTKAASDAVVSPETTTNRGIRLDPGNPYALTADINDPEDPLSIQGIDIILSDDPEENDLIIAASSSNLNVVPADSLLITGKGNMRNLRIRALNPGYSTITLNVNDGKTERAYWIEYAVSKTSNLKTKRWHAGISDASAALDVGDGYMLVANDESNFFYLFSRHRSSIHHQVFDFNKNNILLLTDSSEGRWKEVDVEAAVQSPRDPALSYWIGSMSNNSSLQDKPNRNRVFAVRVSGKGEKIRIDAAGHYTRLRQDLISWGDANGYDFKSSAAPGREPKAIDGFNIEGMVFGPDKKTLYIGFRAPLVPMTIRTKAVIAPVQDFEAWFNKGMPKGSPLIGKPIELDLGGRGIRDIISLHNGKYLIIAGSAGGELVPAAYSWTGNVKDAPLLINDVNLAGLNVEGVLTLGSEGPQKNQFQVLTDNGRDKFYGDSLYAKDLADERWKKFSSVVFVLK
jgi:hypothetical protein